MTRCEHCLDAKHRTDDCPYVEDPMKVLEMRGTNTARQSFDRRLGGITMVERPDMVLHPQHYARWKMEPIEFIALNDLPWWLANVIKYTMRWDAKDGLQDLYKARSYLDMKIRQLEGHTKFWQKPVAEERTLNLNNASR